MCYWIHKTNFSSIQVFVFVQNLVSCLLKLEILSACFCIFYYLLIVLFVVNSCQLGHYFVRNFLQGHLTLCYSLYCLSLFLFGHSRCCLLVDFQNHECISSTRSRSLLYDGIGYYQYWA
jgi:hypothetical protein